MPWFRHLLVFAVAAPLAIAVGCKRDATAGGDPPPAPQAVPVTVAPSLVGPVQRTVEVTGTLFGDEEATVSAKVPGRIVQILKDVGDRAPAGQPLAQIDQTDYELAVGQKNMAMQASLAKLGLTEIPGDQFDLNTVPTVERARLQSANAEAKFNRGKQLFDQKPPLISEQDYNDLETAFQVAKSNYEVELLTARSLLADARAARSDLQLESQRLRDTTVRAPEPATTRASTRPGGEDYALAARLVSIGEYVREGTPLFRLLADDPVKFRAQVPERFLGQVKVGQAVRVRVEAYPDLFSGAVSRISPAVDRTTRTFEVEMLLPNSTGRLQPGSFARGSILTRVEPDVTLVPEAALVTFAGVTKVYAIADGKAQEHKIETGQRVGDAVEVTKGLRGAVPLVIEGRNRLATGTPVTINAATQPTTRP